MSERIATIVEFLTDVEGLKLVERKAYVSDMSRRENWAEQSWQGYDTGSYCHRGIGEFAETVYPTSRTANSVSVPLPLDSASAAPMAVAPDDRIPTIDILRALALFGILMVNLLTEFRISIFQQFLPSAPRGSQTDRLLDTFVSYAFDMKSFALFSLLFGVGMAIQYDRLATLERPLYWMRRRLLVLLAFGLFHLLF